MPNEIAWQPTASLSMLRQRADMLAAIRRFFAARDVLEVDTPAMSHAGVADLNIHSFKTRYRNEIDCYLHTSPEFPMKRLLAAGAGSIYQICKVFRDDEQGRWHNPEFTMLEWYRPGFDHNDLMNELDLLLQDVLGTVAAERLTYQDAFLTYAGCDPFTASSEALQRCSESHGVVVAGSDMRTALTDVWLDLLMSHVVGPALGRQRPTFIYDYPPSQAALARVRKGAAPRAERFELYFAGVELANGFHELTDASEQRARFVVDQSQRRAVGLSVPPFDEHLLAALNHGLPPCAGVALGIDRLLMLKSGVQAIGEVIAFPFERA